MRVSTPARRSVTQEARRAQIVAATVEVIADVGYAQASFARIAERARLSSTRLISYHFVDKDELIGAVVEQVVRAIGTWVGDRVTAAAPDARAMLRAYLEGVVSFTAGHRPQMRALLRILLAGGLPADVGEALAVPTHLEEILRAGQLAGEFRDFDVRVMAIAVQRCVESLPFVLEADPDLDCDAFARELVQLFDLGTRR
jgi:AcrR family transcriptional regulator